MALYANANPEMYTDPSGYEGELREKVVAAGISVILATAMVVCNQVNLKIFSSLRRNMIDATLEQSCTVSVTDWKHAVLGFPAHHFDNRWIVTISTVLLSSHLFDAIYATDEDVSSIPGVPAKEKDDSSPSGIPAQEQGGAKIIQNKGKKLLGKIGRK